MTTKFVNTDAAPVAAQAQPDAIRHEHDWVQGPYVTDTVGSGWCVRIDGTDIFADLNQYGCKGRVTFQIARGLASKEEAETALDEWLSKYVTAQQPVSGVGPLTLDEKRKILDDNCLPYDPQLAAVINQTEREVLMRTGSAQQDNDPLQGAADWLVKDCGVSDPAGLANRLGIGYNRASRLVDAARKDADNVQGYDREAEVKAFEEAWVSGTQDLGEDYQAAKKAWLLKAQQDDDGHCRSCQGDFCTAGAECVAMEDTQAPRVVQLTHPKHGTMQINTDILREVANREAGEGTFIDAAGTVWSRPTAYAYAMVCKARDKWQAKAEEARDSALGEAAQALAYRRNLLISQNIVNDIQEGVALYDICIDAVLSLQQNATSTSPDKPKRATPMGELVLQLFDALDEAMRLDKSPTAWKHNPAGTPAQRMEAWQKVHKLRAEIKEFMP